MEWEHNAGALEPSQSFSEFMENWRSASYRLFKETFYGSSSLHTVRSSGSASPCPQACCLWRHNWWDCSSWLQLSSHPILSPQASSLSPWLEFGVVSNFLIKHWLIICWSHPLSVGFTYLVLSRHLDFPYRRGWRKESTDRQLYNFHHKGS